MGIYFSVFVLLVFNKLSNLFQADRVCMLCHMLHIQEKEGLITELRKELRVSDDEHRELLTKVNSDDIIRRIRSECVIKCSHY